MASEQNFINSEQNSSKDKAVFVSVVGVADYFNKSVGDKQAKYPNTNLYSILKSVVADSQSMIVPDDLQQKAIIAMKSADKIEKAAGQDALLFSQMKTILRAVDENFDGKRDTREDREEMLSYAMEYAVNNEGYFVKNEEISGQVNHLAELGVLSYFCEKYNMPFYLSGKPTEGVALVKKIADFGNRVNFTKEEMLNFAQELSEKTGVSASDIVKEIQHMEYLGGKVEASGEDKTEDIERKIDIEKILETVDPRTKTVLKKDYGLRGRKQSKEYTAQELRVSRETVRKIENKGFRQLKHRSRKDLLEGYH